MSRPGSTTAPCGSLAMVSSSLAVAGIEPVEPAAITGASLPASRLASASISRSRRSAASMAPRSSTQRRPGLACDLQESQRQLPIVDRDRRAPGRRVCPRRPGAWSCRPSGGRDRRPGRARRKACWRSAAAPTAPRSSGEFAHCRISSASSSRRSSGAERRRQRQRGLASSPVAASAKAISSSSRSPSATMRGRMAASPSSRSRNTSRASRQARRVGR